MGKLRARKEKGLTQDHKATDGTMVRIELSLSLAALVTHRFAFLEGLRERMGHKKAAEPFSYASCRFLGGKIHNGSSTCTLRPAGEKT